MAVNDIFISYARENELAAQRLAEAFEARGRSVWRDDKIAVGARYREVIQEALNQSACVVVIWSKAAVRSDWVLGEADSGRQRGVLVPVRIDDCEPGLEFRQLQTADLSGWKGELTAPEFLRVAQRIDALLGLSGAESNDPLVIAGKTPSRRKLIAAVSSGAVVLGLVSAWLLARHDPPLPASIVAGGVTMALVPAGEFQIGIAQAPAGHDHPARMVELDAFYIDQFEVSNGHFARYVELFGDSRSARERCTSAPTEPVCGVSWNTAKAYCEWLDKRLPTEAEWEKAARGTDNRHYPWGNAPPAAGTANFCDLRCASTLLQDSTKDDGFAAAAPVDAFAGGRSPYGVYNMAGNVWEWVQDWYDDSYHDRAPHTNPVNLRQADSTGRVVRGGSWNSKAEFLRSDSRSWRSPDAPNDYVGIRCAMPAVGG